jgi:hypothetical protein
MPPPSRTSQGTGIFEVLDRVYATGEPFVANEYMLPLDRNGAGQLEDTFFTFNQQALRNGVGSVNGMMAAVDITDQVRARRALETAQAEREELLTRERQAREAAQATVQPAPADAAARLIRMIWRRVRVADARPWQSRAPIHRAPRAWGSNGRTRRPSHGRST